MSAIKLNDKITIDLPKLIDSRLLIQANSGGGKSWAIRRIVEQAFGKVQIIILDPEGEFTNLRTKFDFVYAGKGGDAPTESRSSALLAHRLLELKASAIVDLYEMPPQERKHFVKLFCEAMVNAPKELWHDVLVIIDEAHVFAPEKGESEAMGAVIDLATRGRKRGYCAVLATQRLPKLNKDAAAECNNKLIGRASQDIDRKRAAEELGFTTKEQIISLRDLNPGEFYAFGPAISREVVRTTIGDVDVKPAPRSQSKVAPPAPSAAVKKILGKLADLPHEAQQEARTIAEYKQQVKTLTQQLKARPIEKPLQEQGPMGVSQWMNYGKKYGYDTFFESKIRESAGLEWGKVVRGWEVAYSDIIEFICLIEQEADKMYKKRGERPATKPKDWMATTNIKIIETPLEQQQKANSDVSASLNDTLTQGAAADFVGERAPLSKAARQVLTYLHNVYPHWKSKAQLWLAAGYAPGTSFNNAVYELTGAGFVEKDGTGKYAAKHQAYHESLLDSSFDPSLSKWDSKLSLASRKILHLLLEDSRASYTKAELAERTGYAMGTSFNNAIYELTGKQLALKTGNSYIINSDMLDL